MEDTHWVPGDSKTPKPRRGMVTGVLGRGSVDVIISFGDVIVGVMGTWESYIPVGVSGGEN